jgi:hypothetical protein
MGGQQGFGRFLQLWLRRSGLGASIQRTIAHCFAPDQRPSSRTVMGATAVPGYSAVLKHQGVPVGGKTGSAADAVRRSLRARAARASIVVCQAYSAFFDHVPNLRLGQAAPDRLDQVWVGDLTYLRVAVAVALPRRSDGSVQPPRCGLGGGPSLKAPQLTMNALQRRDRRSRATSQTHVSLRSRCRVCRLLLSRPRCWTHTASSPA